MWKYLFLLGVCTASSAQPALQRRLSNESNAAHGKVYVACSLPGTPLDCDLRAHGRPPMQSTFKFPLAMAVLHQVEEGKLRLGQTVRFAATDRYETYSPLQKEFPGGDVDVPLETLCRLAAQSSDNIASDILLRVIGGPAALQRYMDSLGLTAIHQQDSERTLSSDQHLQYRNYAEPAAMVALLRLVADHPPLNPEHTALLNKWLFDTETGPKRIKALLPAGTPVAHKTGSSGEEFGRIPATNDVGLITLPDGRRLAIAVFVTDAHVDQDAAEHVIAEIAKTIYDDAVITKHP